MRRVLNPQDQASLGRQQIYHRYFSQMRAEKVVQHRDALRETKKRQEAVSLGAERLRVLQVSQGLSLQNLQRKRKQRELIIASLDQQYSQQGTQLRRMQKDVSKLNQLLSTLKNKAAKAKVALPPDKKLTNSDFKRLKGRLHWPARGGILHRYGSSRNGSSLKWQGVLIGAKMGSKVRAINAGRVIFSDWFQNLGQLIIVDHGDDFMSLYGHNSRLIRSVGDRVETGEVIASVGDSGGRKNSGLYFEVRQKGIPVNPAIWCNGYDNEN